MDAVTKYIKPELTIAAIALYFVGKWLKNTTLIKDKYIPLILGLLGIFLSLTYVLSTTRPYTVATVLEAIFTATVQGILIAGLSTYVDQLIKQGRKDE